MTEREIKEKIIERAEQISKILKKGKDCELRKSPDGVVVIEVDKKVIK